jgi:carboxyl-terminal processing protease
LSDGSVIRLGVTNWLTPDMKLIKKQGIAPDIQIKQDPAVKMIDTYIFQGDAAPENWPTEDSQFNSALYLLRLLTRK